MTVDGAQDRAGGSSYTLLGGSREALDLLLDTAGDQLPKVVREHISQVNLVTANNGKGIYLPCPFKETEAATALKIVEASAAAAIADVRYGTKKRRIEVDLERATSFLFSTYIVTVDGMDKGHPNVKTKLKDTDLLGAQSILYRRLSANLYETKNPGEYFHLHGSLEATIALNMVGLPGHDPEMTEYHQCINRIESHVKQFTADELENLNAETRQAGVTALTWQQFQKTNHGRRLLQEPPWRLETLENSSPPAPFVNVNPSRSKPQILQGIKVLELCRVIAGPAMGRTLAEYGADVMKVTSPNLSDVPFFQVDGNMGKHTTDLNLRDPKDRKLFEGLLQSADVVLDGYRPGALERLGYGPHQIIELTKHRGKGIVYVAEDCFGHVGEWAGRPGWQQIADCVSGVAWAQGVGMGLEEPVVPPFPMSDYGTGCMGAIAALLGLLKRATVGGSYHGTTSLVQYDIFLLRLGLYSQSILSTLREEHDPEFFALRHYDSVDEVSKRALKSMRQAHPELFDPRMFHETWSKGFNAPVKYVKSAVRIEGTRNGFVRSARPNGFDRATWDDWEVEPELLID